MRKMLRFLIGFLSLWAAPLFAQSHTVTLVWTQSSSATVGGYYVYRESVAGACTPTSPAGSTCTNINATPAPGTAATCPASIPAGSTCLSFVDSTPTGGISFYIVRTAATSACAPHSTVGASACESDNSPEISVTVPLPRPQAPAALIGTVN